MKRNLAIITLVFLTINLFSTSANAKPDWQDFLRGIRHEAINQGVRPEVIDEAFQYLAS